MEALGMAQIAGGLQYVDDGFWLLLRTFYYEAVAIITMFWHLIGAEVSFPKVRVGIDAVDCIGVTVDMSAPQGPSFAIKREKVEKLKSMLVGLLQGEKISLRNLRSLTGKLTHYTQLRLFLRSYIQPFHALISVMVKKGIVVAKCPKTSEIGRIAAFFVQVLEDLRALAPVGPLSRRMQLRSLTAVVMVAASTYAVGGVLALCAGGSSYPASSNVKYFRTKLSTTTLGGWSCLLKDPEIPAESRNVTAFELLAACLAVINLERAFGSLGCFNVVMYTDNEAVRHILSSMYSRSPGLAKLLRAMCCVMARLSMAAFLVQRVQTEQNCVADTLSRCRPFHSPAVWEELGVSLASIPQDF
ncbi:hypothetical protein FOL47_002030 [Perkinsus chesapeaki]|uniref:Uncharacterized protein n=1 Tax=Perkinsus chesapeaki TaxID=330153 RepID=A0A7J6KSD0_PERCH|nr:hypothetical protein FOL47_002030 [Perkinsus chesapeaki]